MAKFTFTVSNSATKPMKKETKKTKKVLLEKHSTEMMSLEKYAYIGDDNKEHQYSGILSKTSNNEAYGKIYELHNVDLTYHPAIEHVDGKPECFTYIGPDNKEQTYKGKVEYDIENNTYVGTISNIDIDETMIQIFEEK